MVKLLDKYVIQLGIVFVVVMIALIAVLGPTKGVAVGGKATDVTGTATGAVLGFIPRFFQHIGVGQELANPGSTSAQAGG